MSQANHQQCSCPPSQHDGKPIGTPTQLEVDVYQAPFEMFRAYVRKLPQNRARTYPGIAVAMAVQWGGALDYRDVDRQLGRTA